MFYYYYFEEFIDTMPKKFKDAHLVHRIEKIYIYD